ncbi:SubName: Full=Uncharacterized protein {ECO:0000313/EMBL:CCA75083.1} [Serendipita indica DSM 11827]|uniref:sn-1-specific diacylglycerol lipase n=1 Tax=Serendipita indica (strain DSM 11827) TaxID=1109443 RepID=G4TUU0_SERID|nr:SubName: Full=Uncharacterized protein {ECO:0000313/EMBL:CCA75083.1} [Serendipita indica DSM 11827]CCA75083.1 hypothetical protein PIIN_09068 [Serendipita indica DSM 11827]
MSGEPKSVWEVWTRRGISAASVATSFGFYTARKGTQIGFGIARGVTSTVLTVGSSLLSPLTPAPLGAGIVLASAVTSSLNLIEQAALLPLDIGQAITSTSLTIASSSVDVLTSMLGSHEASFSLAEFVTLVKREWNDPVLKERLPADKDKYGVIQIGKALIAWAALQCATRGWHESRWRDNMREIGNEEWTEVTPPPVPPKDMNEDERRGFYNSFSYRSRTASILARGSRICVHEDLMLPEQRGQVISAEIGEKWDIGAYAQSEAIDEPSIQAPKLGDIRLNLRRLSKLVLGSYGGTSLLFFGIPYPGGEAAPKDPVIPPVATTTGAQIAEEALAMEETVLVQLVNDAEAEEVSQRPSTLHHTRSLAASVSRHPAWGSSHVRSSTLDLNRGVPNGEPYPNSTGVRGAGVPFPAVSTPDLNSFESSVRTSSTASSPTRSESHREGAQTTNVPSWWELLTGQRDREIFEGFAAAAIAAEEIKEGAREAKKELDRDMKMNATIGAIEKMPRFWVLTDHARRQVVLVLRGTMSLNELAVDLTCEPVDFTPRTAKRIRVASTASMRSPFTVHGGMLRMAQVMGAHGKPVHTAIKKALRANRGYELVMSGHSLGAGVAGLLALMWADPTTCMTIPASGLPVGRKVSAYCIAPPCFTSAELSRLAAPMITSFVYSHDVVSRLSLGSIRDLSRACWWLSDGKDEESCSNIIKRSWGLEVSTGLGWWGKGGKKQRKREEEKDFLLSLRKTLEANMHMADLYPAGNVFWAIHENDIDATALPSSAANATVAQTKLRLFKVDKVEMVFDQVVFARDMLTSHMPHNYDRMLHEFL